MRKKNSYMSKISLARTVFGLLLLLVLTPLAQSAQDRSLFVDAAAPLDGDGTHKHPFVRISDAVERARAIHRDSNAQIVIHVAPGTYVGSYTNTGPRIEPLPIRLDVPRLKLLGSTSMERDESDRPTGEIEPGSNTLLLADPPLVGGQVLLRVASTSDEVVDRVTIAKLSLDTRAPRLAGGDISVDRVQDFTIRDNYITAGMGGEIGGGSRRSGGPLVGANPWKLYHSSGCRDRCLSGECLLAREGAGQRKSLREQPKRWGLPCRQFQYPFAGGFALRSRLRERSQRQYVHAQGQLRASHRRRTRC